MPQRGSPTTRATGDGKAEQPEPQGPKVSRSHRQRSQHSGTGAAAVRAAALGSSWLAPRPLTAPAPQQLEPVDVEVLGPEGSNNKKQSIMAIIEAARSGKITDEELRQRMDRLTGNPAFEDAYNEVLNESERPPRGGLLLSGGCRAPAAAAAAVVVVCGAAPARALGRACC